MTETTYNSIVENKPLVNINSQFISTFDYLKDSFQPRAFELDGIEVVEGGELIFESSVIGLVIFYSGSELDSVVAHVTSKYNNLKFLIVSSFNELVYWGPISGSMGWKKVRKPFELKELSEDRKLKFNDLVPLTNNVEKIFFELHSDIRDIDGLHPGDSLNELVKVLYAKIYDEKNNKKELKFSSCSYSCVAHSVVAVNNLFQQAVGGMGLNYQDSKIKLSSKALYKIIEGLESYTLIGSDADLKARAFQKIIGRVQRSDLGQFFTPNEVVEFISSILGTKANESIIDPFSGSGTFLKVINSKIRRTKASKGRVVGFEKNNKIHKISMIETLLRDLNFELINNDSLLSFSDYDKIYEGKFDVAATNPPFGSLIKSNHFDELGDFELLSDKKSVGLEVLGLERCIQFLKPGGRLGIVLPDSIIANRNMKNVRSYLSKNCKIVGIVSLPDHSFSYLGANVKTSLVFLRKLKKGEKLEAYKIFMAVAKNIGYEPNGDKSKVNDLNEIKINFKDFLEKNGW